MKNAANGFSTWVLLFALAKLLFASKAGLNNPEKSLSTNSEGNLQEESTVEKLGTSNGIIYHESIDYIAMKVLTEQYGYPEPLEKAISKLVNERYEFTINELDQIFAITNCNFSLEKSSIAIQFAKAGFVFPIDILLRNRNPSCDGGWSVAHEMAMQKHRFSVEDLIALGNPTDIRNLSISDIMTLNGHTFTEEEQRQLGINDTDFDYSACATYFEDYYNKINEPIVNSCIKCGGEFNAKDISSLNPMYADISSMKLHECPNCHWWVVDHIMCNWDAGMSWDTRVLLIGMPKPHIPGSFSEQEPWRKFIFNSKFFKHSILISGEIMKLFAL